MPIVFDHDAGEVYVENPARDYPKQEANRVYYYRSEGQGDEQKRIARIMVNRMRTMYDLGKQHRSEEIRKILGV